MNLEEKQLLEVCKRFHIEGEYHYYEVLNSGHINTTYCVYYFRNNELKDYIIQRVNTYVFEKPIEVMENISNVTEYVRQKIKQVKASAKRDVLHYSRTENGEYYTFLDDGSFWRCCRYIDDSVCFTETDNLKVIEEAGKAFGDFQGYLSDYPVDSLHIVIPHFHNTMHRYEQLRTAIKQDEAKRLHGVQEVVDGYLELEDIATKLYKMQREGILPLRVTHNDTKISNVMFDAKTLTHLSVIDLDTVMPGLVAFDFGDAIRVVGSTAAEDEPDMSKIALDMNKYEAFAKGFVTAVKDSLTEAEKRNLALGAVAMTLECGSRFLTDYLNGDKYFKVHYPEHNLVRAKGHLVLAKDMISHLDEMQKVVDKYCEA